MLSRATWWQLGAFVVVTFVALLLIGVQYLHIPQQLGYDRYEISLRLPEAGGLYPNANVTYQGVEIGRVERLTVGDRDVGATLILDDDVPVPADVRAQVRSTSAVGEQYVNLVPPGRPGGTAARARLRDGDVITADRAELPVSTARLLTGLDRLLASVPRQSLITTVDELYLAFNGSGGDLQRLLDAAMTFQDQADANLKPTLDLLRSLVPVLRTQHGLAPEIQSYTHDLASFTGQLAASDDDLRSVIHEGVPLSRQVNATFNDLRPTLPPILADLATTGQVTRTYLPNIEHTLIVLPAVIVQMQNAGPPSRKKDPLILGSLDFKLSVNDPPTCSKGFEEALAHRDPNDLSDKPPPRDSYCKVPQNDPRVVRGARNLPCPNDPERRSATAAGCGLVFDRVTVRGGPAPTRDVLADEGMPPSTVQKGGGTPLTATGLPHLREQTRPYPLTLEELMTMPLGR